MTDNTIINLIIKSKNQEELSELIDEILFLECKKRVVDIAIKKIQELQLNYEKEIKNFDIGKLNERHEAFDELSPHLFLKPGTFRKVLIESFEIKFKNEVIKEEVSKKDIIYKEKLYKEAKKTIVYSEAYETLRKKLNFKNLNCKIEIDIGDPRFSTYIMSLDIFNPDNPFYSGKVIEKEISFKEFLIKQGFTKKTFNSDQTLLKIGHNNNKISFFTSFYWKDRMFEKVLYPMDLILRRKLIKFSDKRSRDNTLIDALFDDQKYNNIGERPDDYFARQAESFPWDQFLAITFPRYRTVLYDPRFHFFLTNKEGNKSFVCRSTALSYLDIITVAE